MLDENLPTYRFRPSSDNPFHTLLYFTHQGSDPSAEYLVKRPVPSAAKDQYALGLLDAQHSSVIYAEVLLKPEWSQPTLSAAEVRAAGSNPGPQVAVTPDAFTISLYNPDQSVVVKQQHGSWGKSDAWEFAIPERTFRLPSASRIDQDSSEVPVSELVPKVVLRWKRDGRLSRDMTCYMCGRSVGGKKSKEPDITVALFQGKHEAAMTLYEPNMRRVEVEDRKGLEMVLLMSAEVIRDLYLSPRQDPFNTAGTASTSRRRTNSRPAGSPPAAAMAGALGNARPSSPPRQQSPTQPSDARRQAEVEAETRRLQAMVAEEERQARERARSDQEEQKRIQKMLEKEAKERRKREAEIERETERLRREYGVDGQDFTAPSASSPPLPSRPNLAVPGGGGAPSLPPRPSSVGPATSPRPQFAAPPPQPNTGGGKKRFSNFLSGGGGHGPYGGPAAASVSGFFGRVEEGRKKVQNKRSVHF